MKIKNVFQILFLGAAFTTFEACKLDPIITPDKDKAGQPTNPPVDASKTQLTSITEADSFTTKITYGSNKKPLEITTFFDEGLLAKDSCIYNAEGKLLFVNSYSSISRNGKPTLESIHRFETDVNGNIIKKETSSPSVKGSSSIMTFSYDKQNRLIRTANAVKGITDSLVATYTYLPNSDVKQVVLRSGSKIISKSQILQYDEHPSYYTSKLFPCLVTLSSAEDFSNHNVLEKSAITYINQNSKIDSIITLTKNAYQYNELRLPIKQSSVITTITNGNKNNSTIGVVYSYGK